MQKFSIPIGNAARVASRLWIVMMLALLLDSAVVGGDVVLDWNKIAVNTATANGQNPFAQARYAAIVQLAVFEAVNAVTGEYRPYLGTIAAPDWASPNAAAIAAAHRTLVTLRPGSAAALDALRAVSLAAIPDGPPKEAGIQAGED